MSFSQASAIIRMKIIISLISFCNIISCIYSGYHSGTTEEIYHWKNVEYENLPLPDNSRIGPYPYHVPENNNIIQMGYHPLSGLMIVTVMRVRPGVPINVGAYCVSDYAIGSSPKIWAFPNNEANTLQASDFEDSSDQRSNQFYKHHNGSYRRPTWRYSPAPQPRIISTYTVNIDEKCNRAFFLDFGILSFYGEGTYSVQKPAIIVYDLPPNCCETRNFRLIRRAELPAYLAMDNPVGLLSLTLDYQSNQCDDLFIYATNVFDSYLAVYDYKKDEFWVFHNEPSFKPLIAESYLSDGDFNFELPLGVVSVALGYPDKHKDRLAYYMPSSSAGMYIVSTKVLKDKKKVKYNKEDDFKMIGYRGCKSQTSKMAVDYTNGVIFFLEYQSNRVRCWNMRKPFNQDNIGLVYQSPTPFYGMMVFVDSQGSLWFNKCRPGVILLSQIPLNLKEVNSAIYRIKVSDAIRGTVCEN